MNIWPVQDAKARFSAMLDACIDEGPQLVTRRGEEAAVLIRMSDWKRLNDTSRRSLKDLLMSDTARCELVIPERSSSRHRAIPEF